MLSKTTIKEHMPVIRRIFAVIEQDVYKYNDLDKQNSLTTLMLENEFGSSRLHYAMNVINDWLQNTNFSVDHFNFVKNKKAIWADLLTILDNKFIEYNNDLPVIEISFDPRGTLYRKVPKETLICEIAKGGMKLDILRVVANAEGEFIKTKEILEKVKSKNIESVNKQIGELNSYITSKLQLPPKYKFIDGEKVAGHRIHPLYNLVFIKN